MMYLLWLLVIVYVLFVISCIRQYMTSGERLSHPKDDIEYCIVKANDKCSCTWEIEEIHKSEADAVKALEKYGKEYIIVEI